MSSADQDSSNAPANDRDQQIERIVDTYLDSVRDPQVKSSWRDLVDRHPDLAPELERRLRFVDSVYRTLRGDGKDPTSGVEGSERKESSTTARGDPHSANGDGRIQPGHVTSVRCPHCGNLLKVATRGPTEVTCGSCGSAVSVDPNATRTDVPSREPKFIGHFRILSKLGQGAFGTAYKAEDTRLGRIVAVKIPRSGSFATENDEIRFIREARHAAQLRHPSIVQVHEIANDHGVPFLVSDYVEGITLSDLISGRRLTFSESAKMVIAIGEAVEFAHAHHVIHRDLKPSNILLDTESKPFITDFGLARQTEGEFTITLEGEVLGTPAYMSPEQAGGKDVDIRTDVYSLGVILYRLVCGELPFRGSQRMMLHQVLRDDPRPPRRLDERVPRDLDTIILKAMAKERERRYPTAQSLVDDLRRWLQSQPIAARPVGVVGKSVRWCRRNPNGALAIAGAAALLLTIAGISTAWAIRERGVRGVMIESAKNRVEALRRLVETHEQNGLDRLRVGDSFGAFTWFSQALGVEQTEEANPLDASTAADIDRQRLRLGMLQQSLPKLLRLWAPGGKIQRLEFSGDGKTLLATSYNGTVQALDPDRDEPQVIQSDTNSETWNSDLDPSGTRACTATLENSATLWDVNNKTRIAFLHHEARVWSANFSPDGKSVATAGADHFAGIWNSDDGSLVAKLEHPGKYIGFAMFSPDSKSLLTVSRNDPDHPNEFRLWDVATGTLRTPVMNYPGAIRDVAFDPSGDRFYAAADDGAVVIWNAQSGEMDGEPLRHDASLYRLRLVDGGRTLVTATLEGTVAFWDLQKRFRKETTIQTDLSIYDIAVDPRDNFLAIANNDKRARVFWQYCGEPIGSDIPLGGHATAVAFHPDGRRLAVGGDDGVVRLWDLAGMAPRHDVIRTTAPIAATQYSDDGRRLLVGSLDDTARQWDTTTFRPIGETLQHQGDIIDCEYDPNNDFVVTASSDHTAQVWKAATGLPVGPRLKHDGPVVRAKFVPGSDRLITTTVDGDGAIWKVGSEQPLHRFSQDERLLGLKVHPNGKVFALSGVGPFLQIRSTEDGSPLGDRINHLGLIREADFSPSGKYLASASFEGGSVAVSELDGNKYPETRWKLGTSIFDCQFGRTDDEVLTADSAGDLILWTRNELEFLPKWSVVDAAVDVDRIAVHPTLPLVIAAVDGSRATFRPGVARVRFHDIVTGAMLATLQGHFRPIQFLRISPDGEHVATGSADGTVRVWDIVSEGRPADVVQRLAYFFEGRSFGARQNHEPLDGQAQRSEFNHLRKEHPETFRCSEDEIRRWEDEVQWVRKRAANSTNSETAAFAIGETGR